MEYLSLQMVHWFLLFLLPSECILVCADALSSFTSDQSTVQYAEKFTVNE